MFHFRIGDFSVVRVEELIGPASIAGDFFQKFDASVFEEEPSLATERFFQPDTGRLVSSIHSWVLRDGKHVVVIDTGVGNGKDRPDPRFKGRFHRLNTPYLERLRAAGVEPESVTHVINTHLHSDHVGWNTMEVDGRWVPTFPNARYIMGASELAHFTSPKTLSRPGDVARWVADSVRPVLLAGLVDTVSAGDTVLPGITVEPAYGHTPGQLAVRVRSKGESGIFTGDAMHQPMQVLHPDWACPYCEDKPEAERTRRRILAEAADSGTIVFPAHFGAPHAFRILRKGDGFTFASAPVASVATAIRADEAAVPAK